MRRMHLRRTGFTLVELLVVIGIVSLVISILMPALSKVRKQAQEIHCAANLRSIGQALTMYTQHYGYYPGWAAGLPAVWPPRLRTFLGGESRVFMCPAQDPKCEWVMGGPAPGGIAGRAHTVWGYVQGEPIINGHGTFFSYGYNMWGTGGNGGVVIGYGDMHLGLGEYVVGDPSHPGLHRELRASRVTNPSETIAIADSSVDGWYDSAILPRRPTGANLPAPREPGSVHRGGANVLFCDGHVQWHPIRDLLVLDDGSPADAARRRMWNNDHQPH